MILSEFLLGLYAFIILGICIFIIWVKIVDSPILEAKLLLITAVIIWLGIFFSLFTSLYSSKTTIGSASEITAKIQLSLVGPYYIALTFAFMLPNFRYRYLDIFQVSIIVAVNIALSIFLFLSTALELSNFGYIRYIVPWTVSLLFILSTFLCLYFVIQRIQQVKNMRTAEQEKFISLQEMIVIVILAIVTFISLVITSSSNDINNFLEVDLPGHFVMIPFSLVFIITAYLIYRDDTYPFLVPIKLYGIIITEKETGITILSKDYQKEIPTIELLGNLFAALDMSLQETIKSSASMEDIVFGDKVVHLAPGDITSTAMIVSKNSLITKSLTRYINKRFEAEYGHLIDTDKPIDIGRLKEFDATFAKIRKYLVL